MPKDRFSAKMPNGSFSTLDIQPTEPGDSAVYLCASSLATEVQSHTLPVQKPFWFPFSLQPSVVLSVKVFPAPLSPREMYSCGARQ
ncbi:T-cell receptor beta chain V region YT35 [Myotis brandtii]|nr:T-cell receptor beta chain V region YT35 [Myotis brandtii]